jgi:hypothetical protein
MTTRTEVRNNPVDCFLEYFEPQPKRAQSSWDPIGVGLLSSVTVAFGSYPHLAQEVTAQGVVEWLNGLWLAGNFPCDPILDRAKIARALRELRDEGYVA